MPEKLTIFVSGTMRDLPTGRVRAVAALGRLGRATPEVLAGLRALAKKPDTPKGVRRAARKALEQSGT